MEDHQPRDVLQDVGPPEQNSEGAENFSVTQTLCVSAGTATFPNVTLAVCSKCRSKKPLSEFYPNKHKANGHESHCKACVLERKGLAYKKRKATLLKYKKARKARQTRVVDLNEYAFSETFFHVDEDVTDKVVKDFVNQVLWK